MDPEYKEEQEIKTMRQRLQLLRSEIAELESSYHERLSVFQEVCGKNGHDFLEDQDNDYHCSRYYYTCKKCDYFTRRK